MAKPVIQRKSARRHLLRTFPLFGLVFFDVFCLLFLFFVCSTDGDASESAFIKFAEPISPILPYRAANKKLCEIPFDSKNKYAISVHLQDNDPSKPRILFMKGAPERVWNLCTTVMINGKVETKDDIALNYEAALNSLMGAGERVLGCAYRELDPKEFGEKFEYDTENVNFPIKDLTFVGLVSLIDPPRVGVPQSVLLCQQAGVKVRPPFFLFLFFRLVPFSRDCGRRSSW